MYRYLLLVISYFHLSCTKSYCDVDCTIYKYSMSLFEHARVVDPFCKYLRCCKFNCNDPDTGLRILRGKPRFQPRSVGWNMGLTWKFSTRVDQSSIVMVDEHNSFHRHQPARDARIANFHQFKSCRKYPCYICRNMKLIDWLSHTQSINHFHVSADNKVLECAH